MPPPPLPVPAPPLPAPNLTLTRRLGYLPPPLRPLAIGELAALSSLPLRARRLADALGVGQHTSKRKGASIEFADYRDYQLGDDLRLVDWRLYARTDRLHLRETHEETPLRVMLLLDVSPSMSYASRPGLLSKLDYARMMLGALALVSRRQRDSIGAALLGTKVVKWLAPGSSPLRRQAVWSLLDTPVASQGTSLPEVIDEVLDLAPRRCLFVLASDFYADPAPLAAAIQRLRYERHDLLALHLADPAEVDFDFADPSLFFDIETGAQLSLDPAAAASAYRENFNAHRNAVSEELAAHGFRHVFARTDTLPLDALRTHLAAR